MHRRSCLWPFFELTYMLTYAYFIAHCIVCCA